MYEVVIKEMKLAVCVKGIGYSINGESIRMLTDMAY